MRLTEKESDFWVPRPELAHNGPSGFLLNINILQNFNIKWGHAVFVKDLKKMVHWIIIFEHWQKELNYRKHQYDQSTFPSWMTATSWPSTALRASIQAFPFLDLRLWYLVRELPTSSQPSSRAKTASWNPPPNHLIPPTSLEILSQHFSCKIILFSKIIPDTAVSD